ncbi:hypothetical protein DHX103_05775 [Planococcus sp. X10-3]|uniref:hypothetical protein n=1 Tax=Planococcus sp. X10-3 TaxID=3061240 RepID=UPI003BB1932C
MPTQDEKVVITLSNRKMFCDKASCHRTTDVETFSFLDNKAKKIRILKKTILKVSLTQISAAAYLSQHVVDVKKGAFCNYQKNMQFLIEETIEAICIDDFMMKKGDELRNFRERYDKWKEPIGRLLSKELFFLTPAFCMASTAVRTVDFHFL